MRHNVLPGEGGGFSDIDEHSWLLPPNVVIRAADIAQRRIVTDGDLYQPNQIRRVWFVDSDGVKHYLELTFYIHPTGAADITLGTVAASATNVVTYTPTLEGRLINESGVQIPTPCLAKDVAGQLLTDYFYHFDDNANQREHNRVLTIEAGDGLWLIRRGDTELDTTGAVTAGDDLVSSTTVAGEVETATAINTGGTIAEYEATLVQHTTGAASPSRGTCLARALETTGAAGQARCWLDLPDRTAA